MASAVNALNALLRGASIDDHDEALRLANAALSGSGTGAERLNAQHAKVVALLKLDRFDDALRALAAGGDGLAARCVLERAYALYKTGDLAGAAEACGGASDGRVRRALRHVAAQVAYRDERFDEAAAGYAALATADDDAAASGEAADVRINALAASAQRAWQGRGATTASAGRDAALDAGRRDDLETFETAYNAGCVALARGDVARAAVLLRRAQQLCEADDGLADDERRAELLPILLQQVYVLARLGRRADAAALLRTVDVAACQGAAQAVAAADAVVLGVSSPSSSSSANPYRLQRALDHLPAPPVGGDRLFAHQARILRRNRHAVELQCYKFRGVQSRAARLLRQAKTAADHDRDGVNTPVLPATVDLGVAVAAAKAELRTGKEGLRRLLPLLDHRPDDVGLLLAAVQLHLLDKNAEAALALLEAFMQRAEASAALAVRFAPGLVALVVALYKLQGRHHAVRAELARALAHWQQTSPLSSSSSSSSSPSSPPASLLRAAGVELLRSALPADQATAAAAFEALHAADPTDRTAVAGLVASLATTASPSDAAATAAAQAARQQTLAASLTPVDQLVQGVDVARLLSRGVAVLAPPAAASAARGKKRPSPSDASAAGAADADAAAAQPSTKKPKTTTASPRDGRAPAKLSRAARKLQAKAQAADDGSFDAAKKLDAERWLPLRDRSSYRPPKGKKGRRRADAATMQGGVVKEEETLALAGGAGSVRVEKAPQGAGAGGSSSAKKRKKGKK